MLVLKPNCEQCNKSLPPESNDAYICTYECTFCKTCVENILNHVCPNCAGNFTPRPIRPQKAFIKGVSLQDHPASTERYHKPIDQKKHKALLASLQASAHRQA